VIEVADYDFWKMHFGQTAGGSGSAAGPAASIPEAGSIVVALTVLGVASVFCRIGGRSRTLVGHWMTDQRHC
jgi:hypothetical protein